MKKYVFFIYIALLPTFFCSAQKVNVTSSFLQNETDSCYVLNKDLISRIQTLYNPNAEYYIVKIKLSPIGKKEVSTLKGISCIYLDNISVGIPVFSAFSSLGGNEPHIYGNDWDGHFLLDNDDFSIHFHKSFLIHSPDFLSQLEKLANKE